MIKGHVLQADPNHSRDTVPGLVAYERIPSFERLTVSWQTQVDTPEGEVREEWIEGKEGVGARVRVRVGMVMRVREGVGGGGGDGQSTSIEQMMWLGGVC